MGMFDKQGWRNVVAPIIFGLCLSDGTYTALGALSYAGRGFTAPAAYAYMYFGFPLLLLQHPLGLVGVLVTNLSISTIFGGEVITLMLVAVTAAFASEGTYLFVKLRSPLTFIVIAIVSYLGGNAIGTLLWLHGLGLPAL
jgi:hypothetical protein